MWNDKVRELESTLKIVKLDCFNQKSYFTSHQSQQILLQIFPFVNIEVHVSQLHQYVVQK